MLPITFLKRASLPAALLSAMVVCGAGQAVILNKDVVDLQGRARNPLAVEEGKIVVLIFLRTDCPISNRYAPEIKRLAAQYASSRVDFRLVYPGADETAAAIGQHLKDYGYELNALRDPRHALVKLSGVTVTPAVAVFKPAKNRVGAPLYHGRIDDRYLAFGRVRPVPTTRDLEAVLEDLAHGKQVEPRATTAVGCFISQP